MAVPPREPSLSKEQRHALALLDSVLHGVTEDQLALVHGFDRDMIAGLVHEGLATAEREVVTGSGRTPIEAVRIRITDAGRRALEAWSGHCHIPETNSDPGTHQLILQRCVGSSGGE
jgi:hypothetical protein